MLTNTQITQLERARSTLTSVQMKAEECSSRGFDQGRIAEACANAELALFEVINLSNALSAVERALAEAS